MGSSKTFTAVAIALLACATFAVYYRALATPFIFDDTGSVVENHSIRKLWPLVGEEENYGPLNPPKDLPTSGRPLVNLTLAFNYHFWQLDPVGYHLFNLVVHLFSTTLLFLIVRRTLQLDYFDGRFGSVSNQLAFLVALLWAVHPLQSETVAYITQRTELLVGFFYLATLYCCLRYWDVHSKTVRSIWLCLTALMCFCGVACKEVMVSAPLVVLLFDRTFVSGSFRQALVKSWPLYVGLFLSWALLLLLNYNAPRSDSAGFHLEVPAYAWWFTQAKVLLMYLKLSVWPVPLSIHYEMPYLTTLGEAWPWILATAVLTVGTVVLSWRRTAVGFVGAWVLLILAPTLIVPIITEVAAERRMYLPLAALLAMLVIASYVLIQKATRGAANNSTAEKRWILTTAALPVAIGVLLAVVLGLVSVRRLAAYHDELSLWQDNVDHQTENPLAHNNLGNAFLKMGRLTEAREQYELALQFKPIYADAYANLGAALAAQGQLQEAVANCQQALRIKPDYAQAHCNLGVALAKLGQLLAAIAQFQEALRLKPDYFNAYYNLGNALLDAGQSAEALPPYRRAIELNPTDAPAHYNFANALQRTGDLVSAVEQYELALQLKPDYAEAHNNLGSTLLQSGQPEAAISQFREVLRLRPDHAKAYANIAAAYATMHRTTEAIAAAQQAIDTARSTGQLELAAQVENWLKTFREKYSESPGGAAGVQSSSAP